MTSERNDRDPTSPGTVRDPTTVLILWSTATHGFRGTASTLGGMLQEEPHGLEVVRVDLNEALSGHSLVQSLASWSGLHLGATDLATRGWPVVEEALGSRRPRVVVAMDPTTAAAVDAWRGEGRIRAPVVGVVLGLRLDPAWARTAVDRLSVADEVQAREALELGLPAECLVPSGIPVCGGFSSVSPDEKEALRRRFDLPTDRPLVLVITHGVEHDQLTGALFQLSMVGERASLLFDVARDDEGAELLRRRAKLYGLQARMFGKVDEAGELWATADVVVSRTHTYVEQRALAMRMPMVHLLPRGDFERETARIWAERGVGRAVDHMATLAAELEMQLAPTAMSESRQTIGEISRRGAAGEVARLIAQVSAQAEQILGEQYHRRVPPPRPQAAPSDEDEEPAEPRRGPLEVIGVDADASSGSGEPPAFTFTETLEDLAVAEAETNRQMAEHQREADRWRRRALLAGERGEPTLKEAAEALVERHLEGMHKALAELAHLAERRRELEGKARSKRKMERSFRKMEVDDALAALKKKIEQEEGG
jgi:UDP-N-acetylglucosamine:LPS N-acetylglucosamine transferase